MRDHEIGDINTALAAIYAAVGYVQKREGKALGYSYAGEADIIEALRPAMVVQGVTARVLSVRDVVRDVIVIGKYDARMQRTTLTATVRFTHGPSGTWVDCEAIGEGMDSGDKSGNKAMTVALKYALRQTFVLETGNDPDDTRPENEGAAPETRQNGQRTAEVHSPNDDVVANWKALVPAMQRAGLSSRDIGAALGGTFSQAALAAYLADPAHTIGTLISAAGPRGDA